METTTLNTQCLSCEQLQAYVRNPAAHAHLYMHISSCELCACAVTGFTAVPFVPEDLAYIHHQIDKKAHSTHYGALLFIQTCIAAVSLVSIFCFYNFANAFSKAKINSFPLSMANTSVVAMPKEKRKTEFVVSGTTLKRSSSKRIKKQDQTTTRIMLPIEKMQALDLRLPERLENNYFPDHQSVASYSDLIYIYDLKVADYSRLYFKHSSPVADLRNYTPSFKETKNSEDLLSDDIEQFPARSILKKGLYYFQKEKYTDAILQFQILLENDPNDINALFYSALAFYREGKNSPAINNLHLLLKNSNTAFYPEAKWQLALVYLKTGEKQAATQLLAEIVNEKGFYCTQAKEQLNGL